MAVDAMLVEDLRTQLPIQLQPYPAFERNVGLVVVDVIHGFCTPGAGSMAPKVRVSESEMRLRKLVDCSRHGRLYNPIRLP